MNKRQRKKAVKRYVRQRGAIYVYGTDGMRDFIDLVCMVGPHLVTRRMLLPYRAEPGSTADVTVTVPVPLT